MPALVFQVLLKGKKFVKQHTQETAVQDPYMKARRKLQDHL